MAGKILQLHLPAADGTQTWQGWHVEGNNPCLRCGHGTYPEGLADNGINLGFSSSSVLPGIQSYEHGTCTGFATKGHDIKAWNCHNAANAVQLLDTGRNLLHNLGGLVQGCTLRQVYCHSEISLVLIRYEGRRNYLVEQASKAADDDNEYHCQLDMADKPANNALIFDTGFIEAVVELHEEPAQDALIVLLGMRLQNGGTKGRGQSQGDKGRQRHGNGNGQGKLTVQHAHHAAQEGYWHEYGGQYEGNGHNRALYLVHGTLSSIHRTQALFHMGLYVLDNNYGIIYYQAYGQYHGKEGQGIDGEAQECKEDKGTDKGYRHCQQRYQSCPPVLQEYEYYQHNQDQCLYEGLHYLGNGGTDKLGAIYNLLSLQIWREILLCLSHNLLYLGNSSHGIGITGKLYTEAHSLDAVVGAGEVVVLATCFYLGNILNADILAITVGTDDDVAKFLRSGQTAIDLASGLLLLPILQWRCTHGTGRCLNILLIDSCYDIRSRNVQLCHLGWIYPDTHGIVRAEYLHRTYAVYTLNLVQQIDICIGLHPNTVIGIVWRVQGNHQGHIVGGLAGGNAPGLYGIWQAGIGNGNIVLNLYGVHIAISSQVKYNAKAVAAAVRGRGGHVVHALGTVYLLLNNLGNSFVYGLGIGTYISGANIDGWW